MAVKIDIEMPVSCNDCVFLKINTLRGHGTLDESYECVLGFIPKQFSWDSPDLSIVNKDCKLVEC